MAHDVFISYSSEDKAIADAVCSALEVVKIRCWIAPRDILPGQEWAEAIVNGVTGSRVMVLIFSSSSKESKHVRRELALAIDSKVIVIPLKIDDIPFEGPMQYFLFDTHWLDAMNPPTEKEIQKLVETARAILPERDVGTVSEDGSVEDYPMEGIRIHDIPSYRKEETEARYEKKEILILGKRLSLRSIVLFALIAFGLPAIVITAVVMSKGKLDGDVAVAVVPTDTEILTYTETPVSTSTPSVTATSEPTLVPTQTVGVVPTVVSVDAGIETWYLQEGWKNLQADDISLWIPPSYIGGNPSQELDRIMAELEAVGSTFVRKASAIEEDPEQYELWALDSDVGSAGFVTTFFAIPYFLPDLDSSNDFLSEILINMPESTEVLSQEEFSSGRLDLARAIIDYPGDIIQAMYVLKEGDTAWMMVFTTQDAELDVRLEVFDQIAQSFGIMDQG